ncbi:MFS transporter, partial [Staphylococcus epidermidis]|uniref:MFS transporter n=1 Tax=Staphylococcus epidermidis TaxID=1282 RepID=UPI0011A64317
DLGLSKREFGLLGSFFSVGYALMEVRWGMLGEKFGGGKMISVGLVWWCGFIMSRGMIKDYGLFYFIRLLFGVGEGGMYGWNGVFKCFWLGKNEKGGGCSGLLGGSYFGRVLAAMIRLAIVNGFNWQAG